MRKKIDQKFGILGMNIKTARQNSGLTQEQLAELISVTPQYLSDLERGKVGTSIPTLIQICEKLNVSSDFLLFGSSSKNGSEVDILLERIRFLPDHKATIVNQGIRLLLEAMDLDPNKKKV